MGTVGLSFGSPTSGQGFDVSSTVSTIVANLQNVETPWKTQLTKLESQDTAISSLGTLFSSLSNDLSSLTDPQGVMAVKAGSSSDDSVLQLTSATAAAATGTYTVVVKSLATTANGYLDPVTNSSDALTGSVVINGTTVAVPDSSTGKNTLSGLVSAINNAGIGVTASMVTDANGSRLSLVSNTSGAGGSLSVTSTIADGSTALNYNANLATGANASLSVNGVTYSVASNTVNNLIAGVTFDLLGTSATGSTVQVVIANDNSGVESTVNQFVSDYNSLISAINTQEGSDSSGNPEPLFGTPTLSLLQQQLLSSLNLQSPNGYLDSISAADGTTLSDSSGSNSMTISLGNGTKETIVVGSGTSGDGTFYTGSGSGYNTLAGLAATINAAAENTPVTYSATTGSDSGTLTVSNASLLTGAAPELEGDLTFTVGSGTTQTVTMDEVNSAEGGTTLSDLATYIQANSSTLGVDAQVTDNGDGTSSLSLTSTSGDALSATSDLEIPGSQVTAAVVTTNGQSSLTLTNVASGTNGAMTVTSKITAETPAALSWSDTAGYTDTTADGGTLGPAKAGDTLSGSVTVTVGSGTAKTFTMSTLPGQTLSDLATAIGNAGLGVDATVISNSDGTSSLSLTSTTDGSSGALTVNSSLYDSSNTTASALGFTNSSDVNSVTSLGISVNNDGSISFDSTSLDSLLNSDFSGVAGFFQNVDGWGLTVANTLDQAGTGASTGILSLAKNSNSSTESTLNAEVSKEQSLISIQQASLTAELNSANEILQELPTKLDGINELYSAITGYGNSTNG